jgi:small subunit ribosomal protein S6
MQQGNQAYELTFILGEKAGLEEGTAKITEMESYLKTQGGSVTKQEVWGRRELAYEIKHNRSGFYVTLWIDFPTTALKALDEHLRFDESIIRSLVTKAYTVAQPGSLYPVPEEEKTDRPARAPRADAEDKSSAEEMLRRAPAKTAKKDAGEEVAEDDLPEEERLKKLDDSLEELLKDEA